MEGLDAGQFAEPFVMPVLKRENRVGSTDGEVVRMGPDKGVDGAGKSFQSNPGVIVVDKQNLFSL